MNNNTSNAKKKLSSSAINLMLTYYLWLIYKIRSLTSTTCGGSRCPVRTPSRPHGSWSRDLVHRHSGPWSACPRRDPPKTSSSPGRACLPGARDRPRTRSRHLENEIDTMKTLILKCTQPCFKQFKFKNIFQKV
jgi:hypothetical protein